MNRNETKDGLEFLKAELLKDAVDLTPPPKVTSPVVSRANKMPPSKSTFGKQNQTNKQPLNDRKGNQISSIGDSSPQLDRDNPQKITTSFSSTQSSGVAKNSIIESFSTPAPPRKDATTTSNGSTHKAASIAIDIKPSSTGSGSFILTLGVATSKKGITSQQKKSSKMAPTESRGVPGPTNTILGAFSKQKSFYSSSHYASSASATTSSRVGNGRRTQNAIVKFCNPCRLIGLCCVLLILVIVVVPTVMLTMKTSK